MQKLAMTAIAASLAFATPAFADDAHHPEKGQETKAAPAKPAAKTAPTVRKMQDNVKKMQAQLDRIAKATTDEERQEAMAEHMQTPPVCGRTAKRTRRVSSRADDMRRTDRRARRLCRRAKACS